MTQNGKSYGVASNVDVPSDTGKLWDQQAGQADLWEYRERSPLDEACHWYADWACLAQQWDAALDVLICLEPKQIDHALLTSSHQMDAP